MFSVKIKKLFFLFFLVSPILVKSQDTTVDIHLNDRVELIRFIDLNENGIILLTGKQVYLTTDLDYTLRFYSSDLNLIWEKPINRTVYYQKFEDILISSHDGSVTYFLENTGKSRSKSERFMITQIDKQGNEKIKLIENVKDLWVHIQSIFCDNDYLYILSTKDRNEISDKYKNKEQLILKRISNKDFSIKEIPLTLPFIDVPQKSTYWYFLGAKDNQFYLVTQFFDDDNANPEKVKYKILSLNSEGKVINTILINDDLEGKHYRPSKNFKLIYNSYDTYSDFYFGQKVVGDTRTYGNLTICDSFIYTSGIWGYKPMSFACSYKGGFYINKYNKRGDLIIRNQKVFPEQLLNQSLFTLHAKQIERETALLSTDTSFTFYIRFNRVVYAFPYTKDGNVVSPYTHELKEDAASLETYFSEIKDDVAIGAFKKSFLPEEKKEIIKYFKNSDTKKSAYYQFFTSSKGDIVLEIIPKEKKLRLLFFKKKNQVD